MLISDYLHIKRLDGLLLYTVSLCHSTDVRRLKEFSIVLTGSIVVNETSKIEQAHQTLILSAGQNENGISIQATDDESDFLLVSNT